VPQSILIVDDSPTVRQQLRLCLEMGGYQVLEAVNGQAGLEQADKNRVSLVISDVNMPIMNGIDFIRELRKRGAYQKTPVFVLTTESGATHAQLGKEAGATVWIVKPFKPEVLLKGIKKVIG
jgi:two-component system chemotaxis response regulator CheY